MKRRKIAGIIAAIALLAVMRSEAAGLLYNAGGGITLYQGESCAVFNDNTAFNQLGDTDYKVNAGLGEISIPVRVERPKSVVPGGQCIGIALYTDGIIIVGCQDVAGKDKSRVNPAADAGLRTGDIIKKVNDTEVKNITEFVLQSERYKQSSMKLTVLRGDQTFTTHIQAAYDLNDDKYRLGLWLKDSTAGIGTMTYYNPDNLHFAALGHAICEGETGVVMPLGSGEIVKCTINEVQKGQRGKPGELKGSFRADAVSLGVIEKNSEYGLYGVLGNAMTNSLYGNTPIGSRDSVQVGNATILTTIDKEIKEYSVRIVRLNRQESRSPKGMVIEVTDKELLEKTGGIVQGMSGSPIMQNGRIIGAVTHVLVNDPTRGYGLFIDWMDMD